MGWPPPAQQRREHHAPVALRAQRRRDGRRQREDQHRAERRAINETIAGTGPAFRRRLAPARSCPRRRATRGSGSPKLGAPSERTRCRSKANNRVGITADSVIVQFDRYLRRRDHSIFPACAQRIDAARGRFAQWNGNRPITRRPLLLRRRPAAHQRRARGRRAVDGAAAAAPAAAWQSPAAEPGKAPALEPIDLPPAIEQGVDMIYIDEELVPRAVHDSGLFHEMRSPTGAARRSTCSSRSTRSTPTSAAAWSNIASVGRPAAGARSPLARR